MIFGEYDFFALALGVLFGYEVAKFYCVFLGFILLNTRRKARYFKQSYALTLLKTPNSQHYLDLKPCCLGYLRAL